MAKLYTYTLLLYASFTLAYTHNITKTVSGKFTLNRPVLSQFYPSNPAIATFVVSNNSVLPAGLWQPPLWSFSIGFVWDTFLLDNGMQDIRYTGTLADGSKLPSWITFNQNDMTFQGSPPARNGYFTWEFALRAHNERGVELGHELFNFTVAARDVSVTTKTLPALNLTADSPFSFPLDDLILPYLRVNGKAAHKSDFNTLNFSITAGSPNWISYDRGNIAGTAPSVSSTPFFIGIHDGLDLSSSNAPLVITIPASVSTSYFTTASFPPVIAKPGEEFNFPIAPHLSNAISHSQVDLSATFEPKNTTWLSLGADASSPCLQGTVPEDPLSNHVNITLKAVNKQTNATSYASLYVSIQSDPHRPASSHSRESFSKHHVLVICAVLGALVGFIILCCLLAFVRRQVGQKAQDAKVKSGRRSSGSGPKEYVIDQLASPYETKGLEQAIPYVPKDLESHIGSVDADTATSPHGFEDNSVTGNLQTSPGRLSKRDFFKPGPYRPARFLRPQSVSNDSPRKPSPASSIRNVVQNTIRSLRKPHDRPDISNPLPISANTQPSLRSASKEGIASASMRSLNSGAPPIPSRSVHSFNASYSQEVSNIAGDMSEDSQPSLEGGVSVEGRPVDDHCLVNNSSHIWVHRQGSSRAASSQRPSPDLAPKSRPITPAEAGQVTDSTSHKGIPRDASDELDEAIVGLAYSINVKDRTSEPKLRRYSSLSSALEDPHRFAGHAFQSTNTMNYSSHGTGPSSGPHSLSSGSVPRPALVRAHDPRRPVDIHRQDLRAVSDRAEVANVVMKNAAAAKSSHILPTFTSQRSDEQQETWIY